MSEYYKGDRVKVRASATYLVEKAAKAAGSEYLAATLLTGKDPCCGCYVAEFDVLLGGTDTFYPATGKIGYMAEVKDRDILGKVTKRGRPKGAVRKPKVGDRITMTDGWDAAKKGMGGTIVTMMDKEDADDGDYIGVRFPSLTRDKGGHSLGGFLKGAQQFQGQWVPESAIRIGGTRAVKDPEPKFKVGMVVERTGSSYGTLDRVPLGTLGVVRVVHVGSIGVEWDGITEGHDLDGDAVYGGTKGWFLPQFDLTVVPGASEANLLFFKVGEHVKYIGAGPLKGRVGIVRAKSASSLGVEFPGWHGGHSMSGTLTDGSNSGYWCMKSNLRSTYEGLPNIVQPQGTKALLDQMDEGTVIEVYFRLKDGEYRASATGRVIGATGFDVVGFLTKSRRSTVHAHFGYQDWLCLDAEDERIMEVHKR